VTSINPTATITASARAGAKVTETTTLFQAGRVSSTSKTALRALVRSRAPIETDQKARTMPTERRPPCDCPKTPSLSHPTSPGSVPRSPGGPCSASQPKTASTRKKLSTATRNTAKGRRAKRPRYAKAIA